MEPSEGKFNWTLIDEQIKQWSAVGVRVSFRISCMEVQGNPSTDIRQYYATPKWVVDAGADRIALESSWEPIYDDPIFFTKLENFHKAFAARYDGNPNVVYIDIGSLGVWGEGHTGRSSGLGWSYETLKKHSAV